MMHSTRTGALAALALLLPSPASAGGDVQFVDVTNDVGVAYRQADRSDFIPLEHIVMTGGAAAGDYDGDGWVDLFVTRLDDDDILFRNRGTNAQGEHLGFENVTDEVFGPTSVPTARSNGCVWGDVDNDGHLDLYITSVFSRQYQLFMNDGQGHLVDESATRGASLNDGARHTGYSPALGDYDLDGYLDLYVTEWGNFDVSALTPAHSRLLRNRGAAAPGFFEDATFSAGVTLGFNGSVFVSTFTFAPRFTDLDEDGYPDLAIAADFGTSKLFWNNGDGTFTDGTEDAGVGTDENGMGITIGDLSGDGLLDVFITSISDPAETCDVVGCNWGYTGNRLYVNNGDRTFTDGTDDAGVRDGAWGWGASSFDYDNDGDLDLVMTNGVDFLGTDIEQAFNDDPMRLWRNDGGRFTEVGAESGVTDTGSGKGLLTFDYDGDGDLDIFVVNNAAAPVLYRNDGGNANDWLYVTLEGTTSNRQGVGAKIRVTRAEGEPAMVREVSLGSNFLGQDDVRAHFGLGTPSADPIARIEITWPSGAVSELTDVARNQTLVVTEP